MVEPLFSKCSSRVSRTPACLRVAGELRAGLRDTIIVMASCRLCHGMDHDTQVIVAAGFFIRLPEGVIWTGGMPAGNAIPFGNYSASVVSIHVPKQSLGTSWWGEDSHPGSQRLVGNYQSDSCIKLHLE